MLARIMPFISLGIFIVLIIIGIIFLSYIFVIGAIVGLIIYSAAWIRIKLSGKKSSPTPNTQQGNVYEHDAK
jgi:ABC-type uncharacterized transport system permease subunit